MLSPREAAAADDVLDRTLAAACLAVMLDGATLDGALAGHLAYLRETFPAVYELVALRLHETAGGMLAYLPDEGRTL